MSIGECLECEDEGEDRKEGEVKIEKAPSAIVACIFVF